MFKYVDDINNLGLSEYELEKNIVDILYDEEYLDKEENWIRCPYCNNIGYQRYSVSESHFVAFAQKYTHNSFQSVKIKEYLRKYLKNEKVKVKTCDKCNNVLTIGGHNCYIFQFDKDRVCQVPDCERLTLLKEKLNKDVEYVELLSGYFQSKIPKFFN